MYNINLLNISAPPDPFVDTWGGGYTFYSNNLHHFFPQKLSTCAWQAQVTGYEQQLQDKAPMGQLQAYLGVKVKVMVGEKRWHDGWKLRDVDVKLLDFQKIGWMKTHAALYFWGERFPRFQWWTSFLFRYRKDYSYKLYWVSSEAFSLTKWRSGESVSIAQR